MSTASLLDGRHVSALRRDALKRQVHALSQQGQRAPGLAVILIGQDPASCIYVAHKRKACEEIGFTSYAYDLPPETSQEALLRLISELNNNEQVDGILVQSPLPAHIDPAVVIECIDPRKDVDGFHPYNLGRLAQRSPTLRPCTPLGIMTLLAHYQIDVKRKHALVVGASNVVGRPMGLELLLAGATVTICHKFTQELEKLVQIADLIIIAVGKTDIVDAAWLQEKQIVVDVGMHRLENGKVRGDLDFEKAAQRVAWLTPVPGGVGPMTIVSLLENTMLARSL